MNPSYIKIDSVLKTLIKNHYMFLITEMKNHFIITDLKKHTAEENPDKSTLEKAIGSLKEVMT